MTITHPICPQTLQGDRALAVNVEEQLCECCYELIVDYGLQNVLACLGRGARVRAGDYRDANRKQYLRHQRAASRIMLVYREVTDDSEQIDRIVAEEEAVHAH